MKNIHEICHLLLVVLIIIAMCNIEIQRREYKRETSSLREMQEELRSMQKEVSEAQWELTDNIHETVKMQEELIDTLKLIFSNFSLDF